MDNDSIIQKLVNIKSKLDEIVTKEEFGQFRSDYLTGFDEMMKVFQKLNK